MKFSKAPICIFRCVITLVPSHYLHLPIYTMGQISATVTLKKTVLLLVLIQLLAVNFQLQCEKIWRWQSCTTSIVGFIVTVHNTGNARHKLLNSEGTNVHETCQSCTKSMWRSKEVWKNNCTEQAALSVLFQAAHAQMAVLKNAFSLGGDYKSWTPRIITYVYTCIKLQYWLAPNYWTNFLWRPDAQNWCTT